MRWSQSSNKWKIHRCSIKRFFPEIKKFADGTDLPDSGALDRLHFKIPNFSLDKVKLTFTDKGLLNLKIDGLSPELSGRAKKKFFSSKLKKVSQ